MISQKLMSAVG